MGKNIPYTFHNNLVLRTTILPYQELLSQKDILEIFDKKKELEALFLATENLLNEYQKLGIQNIQKDEKLIHSLLKYRIRMSSRCTPFGLFAACGIVKFSSENNIQIHPSNFFRKTRLDMNFTCALSQELSKMEFIQKHLKFYPNTSMYVLHDKIRYVEYFYKEKKRVHQIAAVDNSEYLQKILSKADSGATISELVKTIVDQEINFEQAEEFIHEIIKAQLLVSELEPSVSGEELLSQIFTSLEKIQKNHPSKELENLIQLLKKIEDQITTIDEAIGNDVQTYLDLIEQIKLLNIPFERSKLFQADLFLDFKLKNNSPKENLDSPNGTLNQEIQNQLTKVLKIMNKLNNYSENSKLKSFKEAFYKRYEDEEVPLATALDQETGIAFSGANNSGDENPLLEDIYIPQKYKETREFIYNPNQTLLFKKLLFALENQSYSIHLSEEDVKGKDEVWEDLPPSMTIMFSHIGIKDKQDKLFLKNVGGTSATNLLGRFGSGNDEMKEILDNISQHETAHYDDKIVASILHLPESRVGNVLLRPQIRNFEIPYLSKSNLSKEQQIPIDDLMISLKNNRIVLRSKKFNKEVIPRLDNAHNFSYNALPLYEFLCVIQEQNKRTGFYIDWGSMENEFSFLPRVEIENVIVSPATWQLKKEQFNQLFLKNEQKDLSAKSEEDFDIWQKRWKIPNTFYLSEGDNELLINTKSDISVNIFLAEIKNKNSITLKESLFDEKSAIIHDDNGKSYHNEFVAILMKDLASNESDKHQIANDSVENNLPRNFTLGTEWLYYKIYCGTNTAEKILTEIIKPFTENILEKQWIDSWFFIRYADPDTHLRVRFHFSDTNNLGKVIEAFHHAISEFVSSGLIWNLVTGTYQREIERYGQNTMLLSEKLFHIDSLSIINLLDNLEGREGEELRWLFALKKLNDLLDCFHYTFDEKLDLLSKLRTNFGAEFNMNKHSNAQLDKKFRTYKSQIESIIFDVCAEEEETYPLHELLNHKNELVKPIANEIMTILNNNENNLSKDNLLSSYIHMMMNRLFKSNQRMHEMVVYDFMWRVYKSYVAKNLSLKNNVDVIHQE